MAQSDKRGACPHIEAIDTIKQPASRVCEDCVKTGARWVHLRTCQSCGGTRCCDSSPNKHASKHAAASGHPVIASAEQGERWLYCYPDDGFAGPDAGRGAWPALPYAAWQDTYATLHMWTQMVGKVAVACAPPLNHCWGIAFLFTPRGLRTRVLAHGAHPFTIAFDFLDHRLVIETAAGARRELPLSPRSVADFYRELMATLDGMGLPVRIWSMPVELAAPIRFEDDTQHCSYDREYVERWWRIVLQVHQVFGACRVPFIGKCSPVHFFWGAFDIAVTRFSGRPAPPRDGPAFMRDAYSHEVISHGFWPGSAPLLEPAFYAYAVPEPGGLKTAAIEPEGAYYHPQLGEFILPYEVVRAAASPEAAIAAFVNSTYDRAASLAAWDRAALERNAPDVRS